MRIAYMLTSLGIGGAERQVIAIGERMAARGHEVQLIVLKPAEDHEWPTALKIQRLGITKSVSSIFTGMVRARRLLRLFKPDLLHSHTFPANMLARSLSAFGAAPLVLSTIHNIYEGGWHRSLAYRITDPFCKHTTAVSQAIAHRYIQTKAVPAEEISVITNGIDTEQFSLSSGGAAAHSHNGFIWLAAGRDVPAKDFDGLLISFQKIRKKSPDAQLWIAGQPARHRSTSTDSIAEGVRWLGLSENMPRIFAACDAFVLSSAWEGMPLVVGEAMAMEKPVVATDVGGVRELVGDTGKVVPSRDPDALAEAMMQVMRAPALHRSATGKAARQRILLNFDMNAKVTDWDRLYSRILREHQKGSIRL